MKKYTAGLLICLAISIPAWFLGRLFPVVGGPVCAILIGMAIAPFIKGKERFRPGIAFTSKKILQYAVVLLGFGMNLSVVLEKGRQSLPIILATITTSILIAVLLFRLLKIPTKSAILIGVGSSICGGSAIAAAAPVIDADDEEIAQAISVIFLFNVIAALIFPTLGKVLGLTDTGFGLFAGTAVNDTSSVTAAASTWDTLHGTNGAVLEYATIVKLTRTLAIIPVSLMLAFVRMQKEKKEMRGEGKPVSLKNVFPTFILYFVAASIITTVITSVCTGPVLGAANEIFGFLKQLSKFFIVMAMAAIGINTNVVKLVKTGGKPIALGFTCWVAIALVSLTLQQMLGIW